MSSCLLSTCVIRHPLSLLIFITATQRGSSYYLFHFTDKEAELQRDAVPRPRSPVLSDMWLRHPQGLEMDVICRDGFSDWRIKICHQVRAGLSAITGRTRRRSVHGLGGWSPVSLGPRCDTEQPLDQSPPPPRDRYPRSPFLLLLLKASFGLCADAGGAGLGTLVLGIQGQQTWGVQCAHLEDGWREGGTEGWRGRWRTN